MQNGIDSIYEIWRAALSTILLITEAASPSASQRERVARQPREIL